MRKVLFVVSDDNDIGFKDKIYNNMECIENNLECEFVYCGRFCNYIDHEEIFLLNESV